MANYLPSPRLVPKSFRLGIYTIGQRTKVDSWEVNGLPLHWNEYPYPSSTQDLGSVWLQSKKRVALKVPSAAVPGGLEKSIIINPLHPAINQLELTGQENDIYNNRTFSSNH